MVTVFLLDSTSASFLTLYRMKTIGTCGLDIPEIIFWKL